MSALQQTHLPLIPPTTSVIFSPQSLSHPTPLPFKLKKKKSSWDMSSFFFIMIPLCVMFPHISHSLQHRLTQLLILSHIWLIEDREDVDTAGQIRSLKLYDVPYSAGAAELWSQDSRWARLGWGPFKSNRIESVPIPASATLSEQITCSSKGYDSPWHLCWDPAIPDSWGLILNSYKCGREYVNGLHTQVVYNKSG